MSLAYLRLFPHQRDVPQSQGAVARVVRERRRRSTMSRITNRLGWGVAGALAIALLATLGGVIYAGPLTPPTAPSATGPTQIFQPASCAGFPITISSPGTYVVEQNITGCSGADGFHIASNNVTLDLNGFAVIGVAGSDSGIGLNAGTWSNIEVRHGVVANWGLDGVVLGPVAGGGGVAVNSRVDELRVSGMNIQGPNTGVGIVINSATTVMHSSVSSNTCGIDVWGDGNTVEDNTVSQQTADNLCDINIHGSAVGIVVDGHDNAITHNTVSYSHEGIEVGLGGGRNRIDGNVVNDSTITGIEVGSQDEVTSNSVTHNGVGITAGAGSRVTGNNVSNNTGDGIDVGAGSTIEGNTVSANSNEGIHVSGSGNNIVDNTVSGNNTATGSLAAINVLSGANRNRIDSNYIDANGASHAVEVDGTSNTITRNTGGNSAVAAFNFPGAGNTFGPTQVQATPLSNPWANIVY
jgi:parallel beta-helix repeat protein